MSVSRKDFLNRKQPFVKFAELCEAHDYENITVFCNLFNNVLIQRKTQFWSKAFSPIFCKALLHDDRELLLVLANILKTYCEANMDNCNMFRISSLSSVIILVE